MKEKNSKQAIDEATLQRVTEVCRLKLSEAEKESFKKDLNEILGYFSQISEIQEKGRELYYVKDAPATQREDAPVECKEAEGIRSQFTRSKNGVLLAPKSL